MTRSIWKLGNLAGLAVVLMSGATLGQGRVDRHVVFAEENGACIMTAEPTSIHAQRSMVILWLVRNECDNEITVSIGNFSFNGEPASAPVDTKSATVPSGKQRTISGLVKEQAMLGTYQYEILAGGQSADPELVVDAKQ